jgi:hypothetical protein
MLNIDPFNCNSGSIELDFLEREETSERAMKLGIRLHLAKLSL